jgi:hypothetical protein
VPRVYRRSASVRKMARDDVADTTKAPQARPVGRSAQ